MATQTGSIDLKAAKKAHDDAEKVATNYLAVDESGIMVYDGTNGTQTPSAPDSTTNNVFIDDDSLDIRRGTDVLATFGADGSRIGQFGESLLDMNYRSLQLKDRDEYTYFYVSELLDKNGNITEQTGLLIPVQGAVFVDVGFDISAIVEVLADGVDVTSDATFNQKRVTIANVAETIFNLVITYTPDSPSSWYSASYFKAYTIGIRSKVADGRVGGMSTVIGYSNDARGFASLAEGQGTTANGGNSHAQNYCTEANYDNQTAIGKFNDNQSDTAFEIGNGTSKSARSNAFTVDWDGNTEASGDITDGSGNVLSNKSDASSLAAVATSGSYNDLSDKPTILTTNFSNTYAMTTSLKNLYTYTCTRSAVVMAMFYPAYGATQPKQARIRVNDSYNMAMASGNTNWENAQCTGVAVVNPGDTIVFACSYKTAGNNTARITIVDIPL